jgi:hypothetical protein
MTTRVIQDFLGYVEKNGEPAAIIASGSGYDSALDELGEDGFIVTGDYQTAIEALSAGTSVAIEASHELPSDLYDILRQYSQRRGIIQVLPKAQGVATLLQLDTQKVKLILVVDAQHEARQKERYPELFELVGMVDRI